jgi:hypothetical protein
MAEARDRPRLQTAEGAEGASADALEPHECVAQALQVVELNDFEDGDETKALIRTARTLVKQMRAEVGQ